MIIVVYLFTTTIRPPRCAARACVPRPHCDRAASGKANRKRPGAVSTASSRSSWTEADWSACASAAVEQLEKLRKTTGRVVEHEGGGSADPRGVAQHTGDDLQVARMHAHRARGNCAAHRLQQHLTGFGQLAAHNHQ